MKAAPSRAARGSIWLCAALLLSGTGGCSGDGRVAEPEALDALVENGQGHLSLRQRLESIRRAGDVLGISAEVHSPHRRERARAGSNDPQPASSAIWQT
jgi:hypothetical protein